MRRTNVKCPVCNQTHPNTHMQLLDWQTATYPCPIVGQAVNIENFIPGAITMLTSPGTVEDPYQDTSLTFGIADTVPFIQSKAPTEALLQTILDDTLEKMWLAPGAQIQAPVAASPSGDFSEMFTMGLPSTPYQYWGPVGANGVYGLVGTTSMSFNFSHRIYMNPGKDTYLEMLILGGNIFLNYVDSTGTVATANYAMTLDGKVQYNVKIDVVGTTASLVFWPATDGGVNTKVALNMNVPGLLRTPTLVEFSQNYIPPGYPFMENKTTGYQGTPGLKDYTTYTDVYSFVNFPLLVRHNITSPIATTPIAATPL